MPENFVPITKQTFVNAFTQRDPARGEMTVDELVRRLDIILGSLANEKAATYLGRKRVASDCLHGALIRLAQYINDPDVTERVQLLANEIQAVLEERDERNSHEQP